ncbi:hypothetical protein GCM10010299_45540 [Streptomyces tanashiensis]|nr:hypothetical protein GCM10010299_45540 [Streptomyces tanashiensis]
MHLVPEPATVVTGELQRRDVASHSGLPGLVGTDPLFRVPLRGRPNHRAGRRRPWREAAEVPKTEVEAVAGPEIQVSDAVVGPEVRVSDRPERDGAAPGERGRRPGRRLARRGC